MLQEKLKQHGKQQLEKLEEKLRADKQNRGSSYLSAIA